MQGKLRWGDGLKTISKLASRATLSNGNIESWLSHYFANPLHPQWHAGKKPRGLTKSIASLPGISLEYVVNNAISWAELTDKPASEIASLAGHYAKTKKRDVAKKLYDMALDHESFAKLTKKDQDKINKAANKIK